MKALESLCSEEHNHLSKDQYAAIVKEMVIKQMEILEKKQIQLREGKYCEFEFATLCMSIAEKISENIIVYICKLCKINSDSAHILADGLNQQLKKSIQNHPLIQRMSTELH